MEIRYAELIAPRKFAIREEESEISDNQIMIKIVACGLCMWEIKNHYEVKLRSFPHGENNYSQVQVR